MKIYFYPQISQTPPNIDIVHSSTAQAITNQLLGNDRRFSIYLGRLLQIAAPIIQASDNNFP
jgi:hypothetical protein